MTHMVKKEYIREPLRLASMLLTANIPFEIGEMCNGLIICYPCMGDECVSDAICHDGSYGRNEGLLEIMGLVDKEKTGGDSVEGWLTAEEVFERWHKHWLETHAEEEGAISALFSLVAPLTFAAARFLIFLSPSFIFYLQIRYSLSIVFSYNLWYNIDTIKERKIHTMINIRSILKLTENDGMTLKKGKRITHKTGYQVATEGIETTDPRQAINAVKTYGGNCGIWFSNGIYYIDKSYRESTLKKALEVGRACNQISILRWRDMGLVYCT